MKMEIAELEGRQLDYAVAFVTYGEPTDYGDGRYLFEKAQICKVGADPYYLADETRFSRSWSDGGPIIERFGYKIEKIGDTWYATDSYDGVGCADGKTPLVAAMKWHVCSRSQADEIDIPEDL